jgi:23S rRNA (uracil1939-C5)-methyltransferase
VHASPAWGYRNRVRMRVGNGVEFAFGYFGFGSHEFVGVKECQIASPLINKLIAQLHEWRGFDCSAAIQEIELFADAEDRELLVWAFCDHQTQESELVGWAEKVHEQVQGISGVTCFSTRTSSRKRDENSESFANPKVLAQSGATALHYRVGSHDYRISAGSFFQINRHLIEDLVAAVTGGVLGELALDLYAGVGLFSAVLAEKFRHIFSVEASQTSFNDLLHNVPANVKAVGALTEDYLSSGAFRGRTARKIPDLVVMDPPRAGAGKGVIRALVELGAPRVRYVSCDPATLARDLAPLLAAGYRIAEAHLFDLFPETFHIESVMLLER